MVTLFLRRLSLNSDAAEKSPDTTMCTVELEAKSWHVFNTTLV